MKLARRDILRLTASMAAMPVLSRIAAADEYPTRPVRLIVGFAAGAGPDVIARLIGEWLTRRLGQPFVVENRAGGAGNIATANVMRAAPDGHTLLHITVANAIHPRLSDGAWFPTEIAPIAAVVRSSFFLLVVPSFQARTIPDFIDYAKANPGKITVGSSSTGTAPYMSATLFRIMCGIDVLQVPYAGTPQAITELLAGRVQAVFADPSSIEFIKAGKVRALGVTTSARQSVLPDVPSIGDFIPGYEASTWHGVGAPKQIAPAVVERLNSEINEGLRDPAIKTQFGKIGCTVLGGSPVDFGKLIAQETAKWSKVLENAGIGRN
jgi:tripartite-type tricarboxylate transporter receptor subunit TctC